MPGGRIRITGLGAISGVGAGVAATLQAFGGRQSSAAPPCLFKTDLPCPVFEVRAPLDELPGSRNDCRTVRLAMTAVCEALADAGLTGGRLSGRVGVCLGTTAASQLNSLPFYESFRQTAAPPLAPVRAFLNANLGEAVAELLGVTGPRMTVVNACSSGADAIGVAAEWLRCDLCDIAIAGGADELNRVALAGFCSLGVMSAEPCRPFDRRRDGLNLGEGAGILILEKAAFAHDRGAPSAGELAGFGAAGDCHHLTAPHPEGMGLERAVQVALEQAGIGPGDVAFVNAHGTATPDNDQVEGSVLKRLFGDDVCFLSTKGYTGHTLGAAGGLEAVFALLALREGWVPGSHGFGEGDEAIGINPVRQRTPVAGDWALSTSLAFGGNNAAVVVRRAP